ncbi:MAG: methyltransferase domain-containing protein [Elusimicrobiota bacterium]
MFGIIRKLFSMARWPCYLSPVLSPIQYAPDDGLGEWVWKLPVLRFKHRLLKPVVTERIVEIPFVLNRLPAERGARVLDFGCSDSPLSLHMAAMGYRVTGADLREYGFTHPNLTSLRGDFFDLEFEADSFDAVVAVSAVEHVGLGTYGGEARGSDRAVVEKFHSLLKPGGRLLLTVPYGKKGRSAGQRVYDRQSLRELFEGFRIQEERFFRGEGLREWVETDPEGLAEVDSVTRYTQGVALVLAIK